MSFSHPDSLGQDNLIDVLQESFLLVWKVLGRGPKSGKNGIFLLDNQILIDFAKHLKYETVVVMVDRSVVNFLITFICEVQRSVSVLSERCTKETCFIFQQCVFDQKCCVKESFLEKFWPVRLWLSCSRLHSDKKVHLDMRG